MRNDTMYVKQFTLVFSKSGSKFEIYVSCVGGGKNSARNTMGLSNYSVYSILFLVLYASRTTPVITLDDFSVDVFREKLLTKLYNIQRYICNNDKESKLPYLTVFR